MHRRNVAVRAGAAARALGRDTDHISRELAIPFAAKRPPATVSALQDPAAKALVAVLPAVGECDRDSAHESVAVPFVPAA